MTALYLLITLSPLASLSSRAKPFVQTLAGECSGDCRLCGCSAERSASHACCCWQKKLADAKKLRQGDSSQPCQTASAPPAPKAAGSCCSKSAQHADHADEASISVQESSATDSDTPTVSISNCPCGSGKDLSFSGGEKSQHLPFRYLSVVPLQQVTQFTHLQPERLVSRSGEPPVPPPKIFIISLLSI